MSSPRRNTKSTNQPDPWSTEERKALVEYVALFTPVVYSGKPFPWPATKNSDFWNKCADAISYSTGSKRRSGNACRHQVSSHMKNTYASLEEAEDDLGIDYFSKGLHFDTNVSSDLPVLSPVVAHSPNSHVKNESHCHGDAINSIVTLLLHMSCKLWTDLIQSLLTYYMQIEFGCDYTSFVPSDFVELCCKGFKWIYVIKIINTKQSVCVDFSTLLPGIGYFRLPLACGLSDLALGLVEFKLSYRSLPSLPSPVGLLAARNSGSGCALQCVLLGFFAGPQVLLMRVHALLPAC